MTYTQLTQEQRYHIWAMQKAGFNQIEIAQAVGVHKSTICRELRRNTGQRGYRPKQAHTLAMSRPHDRARTPRMTPETWEMVEDAWRQEWSPEQACGWLWRQHQVRVSHERIDAYVYDDKRAGGTLYQHLRCQKQRRKRYGSYDRRGQLANRISISERPAIVETRSRFGDWEADTIVGKGHQQAIVSLTERKSKLTLLAKVEQATADAVETAMTGLLVPLAPQVQTITSDNGHEFARHQQIATKLEADFYFAHPYASWERGLNENTNGPGALWARQYFPKGSDFTTITDEEVEAVMQRLNHRPRKTLEFQTPHQVFFHQTPVALST
jgi:IS30 family transposase